MRFNRLDFVFNPNDFRDATFIEEKPLDSSLLQKGEVIIAVDRLALTANTISYGVAGKSGLIRYLDSFPTTAPYARMPFWGFGDVVASAHDDIPVGERLYGFYPLSTHILAKIDKVSATTCKDMTPSRDTIPTLYREYTRARAEPGYHPDFDDMQSLLRPVVSTSLLLEQYLARHDFYGSQNVIITSASSKTAFAFGYFLTNGHKDKCHAIGLTSRSNKDFVKKIGCYDQVYTYDEINQLPRETSVVFDLAGNAELRARLHGHLGDLIAYSGIVGATHWEQGALEDDDLPGPRPAFWFAPDEIAFLATTGQAKQFLGQISDRATPLMMEVATWLKANRYGTQATIKKAYLDMLDGKMAAAEATIFDAKSLTQ